MKPRIDLFHQLVYESEDGFFAIKVIDDTPFPSIKVYTPSGEPFVITSSRLNDRTDKIVIEGLIASRKRWEEKQRLIVMGQMS